MRILLFYYVFFRNVIPQTAFLTSKGNMKKISIICEEGCCEKTMKVLV